MSLYKRKTIRLCCFSLAIFQKTLSQEPRLGMVSRQFDFYIQNLKS